MLRLRRLCLAFDLFTTVVWCFFAQRFFDTNQLVVFSNTVRTAHRTRFDLASSGTHSQVSNGRVFSFARTVRDNRGVASVFRHFDRSQRFGQGTDLVEFDQDGVNDAFLDTFFQDLGVGYEQVVTHQLDFVAQYFSLVCEASPVRLVQTVFDRHDWVLFGQVFQEVSELFGGERFVAFASQNVFTVFVEFRCCTVHRQVMSLPSS